MYRDVLRITLCQAYSEGKEDQDRIAV